MFTCTNRIGEDMAQATMYGNRESISSSHHSDILQAIFSYTLPRKVNQRYPIDRPAETLTLPYTKRTHSKWLGIALVCKTWLTCAHKAKMEWAQKHLCNLRHFGIRSNDALISLIISNALAHVNLEQFTGLDEALEEISKKHFIKSLCVTCDIKEWPEQLEMVKMKSFSFNSLTNLADRCAKLRQIYIGRSDHEDPYSQLKPLLKLMPQINTLSIIWNCGMARLLENLTQECPNLLTIDLEGCYFTNEGLQQMTEKCTNLEKIGLVRCQTTNQSMNIIALNCPNLREIDISYTEVTMSQIQALMDKCSQLCKIYFSRENTDKAQLEKQYPRLQCFTLDDQADL